MKKEDAVRKKLLQVKGKYLSREYKNKLSILPTNCVYNYRHKTTDDEGNAAEIGLCLYGSDNPEEWRGLVCDTKETAESCPFFTCKHDKEEIKNAFNEKLENDVVVANNYRDIAALQWVIREKVHTWDVEEQIDVELPSNVASKPLSLVDIAQMYQDRREKGVLAKLYRWVIVRLLVISAYLSDYLAKGEDNVSLD